MLTSMLLTMMIAQAEPVWPNISDPVENVVVDVSRDSVLIIAIEDYEHISDVTGATINGQDWAAYFLANGIPPHRIWTLYNDNAYKEEILEKINQISSSTPSTGRIWFVYIGHGANYNNEPIFLDVSTQASPSYFKHSLTQSAVFDVLGQEHDVIGFVDACFSGRNHEGIAFLQGTQFAAPTSLFEMPKVTLLTAGGSDQYAGDLPYLGRPGFSYLALGALRGWGDINGDRFVTLNEVVEYSKQGFGVLSTGRTQEPMIIGEDAPLMISKAKEKGPNFNTLRDKSGIVSPILASGSGVVASKGEFNMDAVRKAKMAQEQVEKIRAELHTKQQQVFAKARMEWTSEDFVSLRSTRDELSTNMVKAYVNAYENIKINYSGTIPFEVSEPLERTITPPEVETAKKWLNGEIKPEIITGKGYKAVLIPSGTFTMGCTEEQGARCDSDEMPVHQVTITKDFYMMEEEVDKHLYEMVMDIGDSSIHPAGVHWVEAVQFVNKLSKMEGLDQCYSIKSISQSSYNVSWSNKSCDGWRLPTEAEWEYAARGNQDFMYGYDINVKSFGSLQISKLFSRFQGPPYCKDENPQNGYGLCGVRTYPEWVWDLYGRYTKFYQIDPTGPVRTNCIVGDKSPYYTASGDFNSGDGEDTIFFGFVFESHDVCRVVKHGRVSNRISDHSILEENNCLQVKDYYDRERCKRRNLDFINRVSRQVGFRPVRTVD